MTPTFSYPSLTYQRVVTPHVALGITGLYLDVTQGNAESKISGGLFSANFYSGRDPSGAWMQVGYGFYNYNARLSAQQETFSRDGFLVTAGYRGKWYQFMSLGISAGALFVAPFKSTLLAMTVKGMTPLLQFTLGFTF